MASTYKVFGQSRPADTNAATLYTVPAGGQAVTSTITVANVSTSATTYSIYVGIDGAAASQDNALIYEGDIAANTTTSLTLGVTLDAGDVYYVQSGTADAVTFQAFGLEIV